MDELEKRFHNDMVEIYKSAAELKYYPTRFLQMVNEIGGYEAAKQLVHAHDVSEGFTKLWELKRLDLSVEEYVLKDEYHDLFTDEERDICTRRLKEYGYLP